MSANEDPNSSAQGVSSNAMEIRSLIEQARSLPRNSRAEAEQSLRRAVDLAASAGLKRLEASARHELGCVLPGTDSGTEEALRELNRALALHIELGDLRGQ